MTPPKIILLCSGRMAVPALHRLAGTGALSAVVCPVIDPQTVALMHELAQSSRVPFHSVSKSELEQVLVSLIRKHAAETVFVIGFPWRIPASLLSQPPCGFLNFHAGPLPALRGPDPVFEAIRQQHGETALTVHQMTADLDTGPIVLQQHFTIPPACTHGLLVTTMAFQAEAACRALLGALQTGALPLVEQEESQARYWSRTPKDKLFIDWREGAAAIVALVRACNPVYGGAATLAGGWCIRITEATVLDESVAPAEAQPGTVLSTPAQRDLIVQCGDGRAICVDVIGTDEGYFPGNRLFSFGIPAGTVLQNHPAAPPASCTANSLQTIS